MVRWPSGLRRKLGERVYREVSWVRIPLSPPICLSTILIMKYNKLIRDRIPEIIKQKGKVPLTHIADNGEYWQKLKEKLKEEVDEFLKNANEEELADILEVIYAICHFKKIDKKELELQRVKKAKERGGFKEKIILNETK